MNRQRTRTPVGRFRFDAAGTPATAVQYADFTWSVVPVDGQPEPPLADYFERYLCTLYGPRKAADLPAGMGSPFVRLYHAALADLAGTDGEIWQPAPEPPGTVH